MAEEFKDINEENSEEEQEKIGRVPLPKKGEVIGIIESRLGGNRMMIDCTDGKKRNGRVPGRLRRRLWLRPGDIIIIQPWELDDTKGDILLKYTSTQINWLKRKGFLEKEKSEF